MKQPDKLTAYYFRAALQTDTLYLDNQMQKLLYHASQNGIATFALYVDNGYNGLNFDRPAFSLMQQDMKNGRLEKIIVASLDRISRNCLDVIAFADCAAGLGVSIEAINGDHAALDCSRQLYAALAAKGGERSSPQSVKRGSPRSHFKQCLTILCARSTAERTGRGHNGFV